MTLDICGERAIKDPSEDDIRKAINELDASDIAYVILGSNDRTFIQSGGDRNSGFDLEYQEGSRKLHFRAYKDDFDGDVITRFFLAYLAGETAWRDEVEWEKI